MLKPILVLVGAIALQTPAAQQTGSLQGIVVRVGSTDPIRKATVEVEGGGIGIQATTTESDGRFYFRDLPPGAYQVRAMRERRDISSDFSAHSHHSFLRLVKN